MISFSSKSKHEHDAIIVLLTSQQSDKRLKKDLERGEIFPVLEGRKVLLFVGLGKGELLTLTDLRIQVRKAAMSLYLKKIKNIEVIPHSKEDAAIKAIIEGILIGTYVWDKYKSKDKDDKSIKDKNFVIAVEAKEEYEQTVVICEEIGRAHV